MKKKISLFQTVVITELIKLRRTVAFWLTILYPAGAVLLASLFLFSMRGHSNMSPVKAINNINDVTAFFLPFYVVLTISFLCQTEHRNTMFKHLISLPVPRSAYFFGKLAASFILMAVSWFLIIALTYASMIILHLTNRNLMLFPGFDNGYLFTAITRTFLAGTAMVVIQYLISLRLRNVVAPITIGTTLTILPIAVLFILGVTGLISNPDVLRWLPLYNPYTYPYSHVFSIMRGPSYELDLFPLPSLIYFLIAIGLSVAGAYEFKNRNFK